MATVNRKTLHLPLAHGEKQKHIGRWAAVIGVHSWRDRCSYEDNTLFLIHLSSMPQWKLLVTGAENNTELLIAPDSDATTTITMKVAESTLNMAVLISIITAARAPVSPVLYQFEFEQDDEQVPIVAQRSYQEVYVTPEIRAMDGIQEVKNDLTNHLGSLSLPYLVKSSRLGDDRSNHYGVLVRMDEKFKAGVNPHYDHIMGWKNRDFLVPETGVVA